MSILLMPTAIDGKTSALNKLEFLATQSADSKWHRLIYSVNPLDWQPELQAEFEAAVERYWQTNPETEQGFWPSGAEQNKHRELMEKKLEAASNKISSTRDMQNKGLAISAMAAVQRAIEAQQIKVDACEMQLAQSRKKLALLNTRLEEATNRVDSFADVIVHRTEDF